MSRCTNSGGYQGPPLEEPEWMEGLTAEIMSSLENHLGWKGVNHHGQWRNLAQLMSGVQGTKPPGGGRRDTFTERGLTEVREAHQRALATVAALEEEIGQLSQSVTRGQSKAHTHSRSWDCHRQKSQGQNRRCHPVWLEESHAPYFEYNPPWRGPASAEDKEAVLDFDLEAPPELGQRLTTSFRGWLKVQGRRMSSPEPPVEDLESW